MGNKKCSFFGHRDLVITDELSQKLHCTIENLINQGFDLFYFGGFGDFDKLCWKTVTGLKEKYPLVKRVFCLYDERHLNLLKRPAWLKDEDFEEFVYFDLNFDWWYQRIYYRNLKIIDNSDYVVFYYERTEDSGAYKAWQYAKRQKKDCINLGN